MGDGSAQVVSIGAGGTHRPDYSAIACGQVAAARRALGLNLEDFARLISERVRGWDFLPESIEAWESDVVPPGDVLLACSAALQGLPSLSVPLLAAVPPAFPAGALAAPWITTYEFTHAGRPHFHADIAQVTAESESRIRAVNHPPEPRSQGRRKAFRNVIEATLIGRHLVGQWLNTSDTRYAGCLQLAVLPGEAVMEGWYTGVGSDIAVSSGAWKWVRLDAEGNLAGVVLRDPAELHRLVMAHSEIDVPLALADIGEEA